MASLAKNFEAKFKEDFSKIPESTIDRLYDTTNGFHGISNPCDFIGYVYPNIFYLEIKTTKGNTLPLDRITQYDKLIKKSGIKGVRAGVIVWFYEKDKIIYVPISQVKKMKDDDKKSINLKNLLDNNEYKHYNIIGVKKRTYFDSDYSILTQTGEGD